MMTPGATGAVGYNPGVVHRGIGIEVGHAGKIRPAGAGAEFDELADVLLVLGAGPAIVLVYIEILLQQHRGGLNRRRGRRKMIAILQHQRRQQAANQDGDTAFGE